MTDQLDLITLSAKCPRCGYDLRGAIDTWKEQCPLAGICTECGLEVKWAEVLHPEKFEPQWCVEFTPFSMRLLRSCGRTFIRSFWPFRFWSMLKMSLDIRWRRLAIYVASLLLPLLIGYVCVQSAMAFRVRSSMQERVTQWQSTISNRISNFQSSAQLIAQMYKDNYFQRKTLLEDLLARDNLDLETQSLIDETKQWLEIIDDQGVDVWAKQQANSQFQVLQQANISVTINHSYLAAIAEAVFLPWSDTSIGSLGSAWGAQSYPPPSSLREYIISSIDEYYEYEEKEFYTTIAYIALGFLTCLLFPLTFIFLPISRKRAKVRWGHVLRVTCYSAFIPSSVISFALIMASIGYLFKGAAGTCFDLVHISERYFMLPMLVIWWAVAIKRYLRISHGWVVAILLTTLIAMGYLFAIWKLMPSFLIERY